MEFSRFTDIVQIASADAVVAAGQDSIIRLENPGAVGIFGYSEAEVVGHSLDIVTLERPGVSRRESFHLTMTTRESRYGEGAHLPVPDLCKGRRQISLEVRTTSKPPWGLLGGTGRNCTGRPATLSAESTR
ncbi:PAS domain S-box protein [Methylobacterium nodulans]|uniref:PAS domain-containing protein n=1 Tax=Methylobacterium nodulans (strain LMG 21967 / CNCM I-2342 / ORS 2060) TaxID=460265 RepID=B8IWH9_METNO|nr:PAS domain S-box protein [Methylobacterium nodulans]ACL62769.1 hypothetical protein Mnod_8712 [Methylobacterium nodulans ORS 2060]